MVTGRNKGGQIRLKVFIDTNVLFSAIFWPNGKTSQALQRALLERVVLTSDYVLRELKRKSEDRFPGQSWRIEGFFRKIERRIRVLETPEKPVAGELSVRDANDRPIRERPFARTPTSSLRAIPI